MKTVWLYELRRFFATKRSIVLMAIWLALNSVRVTFYQFYLGNSHFEISLGDALLLTALLLPVYTLWHMGRTGEDRLLSLLPLSRGQRLGGKLLAGWTLLGILTALLGIYPLLLLSFEGGSLLPAYLGLFFFWMGGSALLAVFSLIAVTVQHRMIAASVSYGISVLAFVLTRIASILPEPFGSSLGMLSVFGGLSSFSYGIFDWRVLLWYGAVIALCLGLLCLHSRRPGEQRKNAKAVGALVLSGVLLASTVAGAFLPVSATDLDLSTGRSTNISDTTAAFLDGMEEDVTIYLLIEDRDGEDAIQLDDPRFEAFLEKYVSCSPRLTLCRQKISESGALLAELGFTVDQVYEYCMVIRSERRAEILDYFTLFTYEHQNSTLYSTLGISYSMSSSQYQSYLTSFEAAVEQDSATYGELYAAFQTDVKLCFSGENYLNTLVEYVSAPMIPGKYVLVGHGEADLSSLAMGNVFGEARPLELSAVGSVPADASSVTILAPASDLSESEAQALIDYLNRGGTVSLVTSESNLSHPNLMRVTAAFGMTAAPGILQEDETVTETAEDGTETQTTERTDAILVSANLHHDVLAELDGLGEQASSFRVTKANAIAFAAEQEDPSLIHTPLQTTSEAVFAEGQEAEKGARVTAAAAENNRGARLCWFTGAEGYLLGAEELSSDLSRIYTLFCPYLGSEWTNLLYESQVSATAPLLYEEPMLLATDTHMVVFGLLSALVLPGLCVVVQLIRLYRRKKA